MFHMKPSRPLAERIQPEANEFRAASLSDAEFPCGLRIPCDLVRGGVRGRSAAAQDAFHPTKLAATHDPGMPEQIALLFFPSVIRFHMSAFGAS